MASSETVEIYEIAIEFAFKLFNSNHGITLSTNVFSASSNKVLRISV